MTLELAFPPDDENVIGMMHHLRTVLRSLSGLLLRPTGAALLVTSLLGFEEC